MSKRDWQTYFFVLKDIWERRKEVVISMAVRSVLEAISPYIAVVLMGKLIDAAYAGEPFSVMLRYACIALGSAGILAAIMGVLTKIFNQSMEYMVEIQNRTLNEKSLQIDYEYLENAQIHEMRQKGSAGKWSSFGSVGSELSDLSKLIREVCKALIAVVIVLPMFLEGVRDTWYVSVGFVLIMTLLAWGCYRTSIFYHEKYIHAIRESAPEENQQAYYLDVLSHAEGQKDLRIYQQEHIYRGESERIAGSIKGKVDQATKNSQRSDVVIQSIMILMSFLVYAFTGWKAYLGVITVGSVVTYAASILKFTDAVDNIAFRIGEMKIQMVNSEDYKSFMTLEQRKYQGTIPMEKRRDDRFKVEFKNVCFKYPGSDQYVIKDLNLTFTIGEKMAIVGKNGSGKTTFIKLLCRLYDVTDGCIKVNDVDIRKYDYEEYCRLFAVVFQDFKVFAFPLGENIAASEQVDEERALDALERAGLGERVKRLEDGLKTYVGKEYEESGVNFSGGEKQKLAIARAIYKNAPFVIMDEPTAALDPESECEVFAGFDCMVGKKTAIYISHRLASCRFCEDILVFDKGQVVQRGSHEQLEQVDGLYRELWHAQAQYYQM